MARRGQISIDRIVAVRSSVLPLYVVVAPDGSVTSSDEVSESDFLTTRMVGSQICFQSIRGDYLSAEGDRVCTRRYCSADEQFTVEKQDTQYAFRSRSGKYLSILDRAPFVGLAPAPGETEVFQLFSLMMAGVNVGKQLELLERTGCVVVEGLLDDERADELRRGAMEAVAGAENRNHEVRTANLAARGGGFADVVVHPLVMQLARRALSPALKISDLESCCTDADFVRKELEATTWHVNHPYSSVEFPGVVDARASLTAVWFLDTLDAANSTWAWAKAPLLEGNHLPRLPHLSSPDEVESVAKTSQPLMGRRGAVWLYLGPVWLSNNVGAASFWKDYDAQTRYKHLSGQKEQSFRALTDAQRSAAPLEELCPVLLQATYVREHIRPRHMGLSQEALEGLGEPERHLLQQLLP